MYPPVILTSITPSMHPGRAIARSHQASPPSETPQFDPLVAQQVQVNITVRDWQGDIDQVWLDGTSMGFTEMIPAFYVNPTTYRECSQSVGVDGGNECGTGFCIDWNGTGTYNADSEPSLGGGNYSTDRNRNSWGVFADMGGTVDTYNDGSWPADNDALWTKGGLGAGGDFVSGDIIWQD